MAEPTLEDALSSTRTVHRLLMTASVVILVFASSLDVAPQTRAQLDAIRRLSAINFSNYRAFVDAKLAAWLPKELAAQEIRLRKQIQAASSAVLDVEQLATRLSQPKLLRHFPVEETTLAKPERATTRQLRELGKVYRLDTPVAVAIPEPDDAVEPLLTFLREQARPGMRLESLRLDATNEGADATPADMMVELDLYFELIPADRTSAPTFQHAVSARVAEIPGTSFIDWWRGGQFADDLVRIDGGSIEWLPALGSLSPRMMDESLATISAGLEVELREGTPERRSVSLFGAEVPGFLLLYAAPVALAALAYYLRFHVEHLLHFAGSHRAECRRFAWLPLLPHRGAALESVITVIALPAGALVALVAQLVRFGSVGLMSWIMFVAGLALVGCLGASTARQLGKLRALVAQPDDPPHREPTAIRHRKR